ncbi:MULTISPECIES: hypothetical protein [Bacillus cereus group]|uniref:hypothetical protein n=1 Tax=Bacillus cereus group TaxID=86661 RepID=UPI001F58608D|nr:hypothetical protein [Bacillus mobilis]MED0951634.1 hypothetical protein [Bacillus mobilis]
MMNELNVYDNDVVERLNKWMEERDSVIRFSVNPRSNIMGTINIKLREDEFLQKGEDYNRLVLSDSFYTALESFLSVEFSLNDIRYNNSRSCFWDYGMRAYKG